MTSRHIKTTMLIKFRGIWPQFPELRFRAAQSSHSFFPFLPLGSACGLVSCCGSRGSTPQHFAAWDGHESVVKRLLVAKAAVDAKDEDGRGLGRGFRGDLLRHWIIMKKGLHVDDSNF